MGIDGLVSFLVLTNLACQAIDIPYWSHILIVGQSIDKHLQWRILGIFLTVPLEQMVNNDVNPYTPRHILNPGGTVP
jgi:hypothetical protein